MPRRGGRRIKTKTHAIEAPVGAVTLNENNQPINHDSNSSVPRSIVAKGGGKLSPSVKGLIQDLRKLMLPYTAVNLKEKKFNRLKDYLSIASVLDISHIMTLSQTEKNNIILKLAKNPNGPTLYFKVTNYSLASSVKASQNKPYDSARAFTTPAAVILNNFSQNDSNHIQVMKTIFQNILPSINVKTVKLRDCRRVVLFQYNKEDDVVEVRHYAIRANPIGITKGVKKLVQGKLADLGQLQDVSDYIESGGAGLLLSDSEAEDEESKIVLPERFVGKGNFASQQSAMKLTELGPRLTLELFKVENGIGEGDILYHKYVKKSESEAAELKLRIESKKALKAERRKQQNENVKRKRELEEEKIRLKLERKRQKYGDKRDDSIDNSNVERFQGDENKNDDDDDNEYEDDNDINEDVYDEVNDNDDINDIN